MQRPPPSTVPSLKTSRRRSCPSPSFWQSWRSSSRRRVNVAAAVTTTRRRRAAGAHTDAGSGRNAGARRHANGGRGRRDNADAGAAVERLLFVSDRDGKEDIYAMNPDGSAQTRLTSGAGVARLPNALLDGSRIVFVSDRDAAGSSELYLMAGDGSGQKRLPSEGVPGAASIKLEPNFSPDGSRIVFEVKRGDNYDVFSSAQTARADQPDQQPDRRHRPGVLAGRRAHRLWLGPHGQHGLVGDGRKGRERASRIRRVASTPSRPGRRTASASCFRATAPATSTSS